MTTTKIQRGVMLVALLSAACACDNPAAVAAIGPELTTPGSPDEPDRACNVVLRNAARHFSGEGFELDCSLEPCSWVFEANVDVSEQAVADGATVGLLYRVLPGDSWWEAGGRRAEHEPAGFDRYLFRISDHLFGPDTVDDQTALELIPFVQLTDGRRLFDHNRNSGELENYLLTSGSYSIVDDATCAPVVGSLWLYASWDEYLSGLLRADGYLVVNYNLDRLPRCRATHNGYPAWDTVANVKFHPSGEVATGSVRSFVSTNGLPTNESFSTPLEIRIPPGTTELELWFHNYSGAGNFCDSWDSNYGANYRYEVLPSADDPSCLGNEQWTRERGPQPYCLGYEVEQQYAATNCELYLNGFGHGYEGHYGIPQEWLEAFVAVPPQDGEVLNVGMYTSYLNPATGQSDERFSFGTELEPNYWKTGFTVHHTSFRSVGSYTYEVTSLAFFLDVRRPTGEVVRLWQSRGGTNYSLADAFSLDPIVHPIPYGNIRYAADGSQVFDTRDVCR